MGLDASELYHMSRADQMALIGQVTNKVLSDQSVGELARLVGRKEETAAGLSSEQMDTALENSSQKGTMELDKTKHAEDRSKERTVEDCEIQERNDVRKDIEAEIKLSFDNLVKAKSFDKNRAVETVKKIVKTVFLESRGKKPIVLSHIVE